VGLGLKAGHKTEAQKYRLFVIPVLTLVLKEESRARKPDSSFSTKVRSGMTTKRSFLFVIPTKEESRARKPDSSFVGMTNKGVSRLKLVAEMWFEVGS